MKKKRFYQTNLFLWLCLIFLPPIGIILLWGCHKEKKTKTKIILSVIFFIWFCFLISSNTKNSDENVTNTPSETKQSAETEADTESTEELSEEVSDAGTQLLENTEPTEELSEDMFIKDVKEIIQGTVAKDESIEDIVFENRDLCVHVDFSQADPSPLTLEDLAIARTSTITDEILTLTQYDTLWDTITINFGDLGYIRNGKDNLTENEYGDRCFSPVNFKLTTTGR